MTYGIKPLLLFVLIQFTIPTECKKNLKVTIYYETGCPDCVEFFGKQFGTSWRIFNDTVEFEFLPYGHATKKYVKDDWEFQCQHGPNECEGNQIHTCAINKLSNKRLRSLHKYLTCCMETKDTPANARPCAKKYIINYDRIDRCANSKKGRELQASIGDKSEKLNPEFVPTVVFNDTYNAEDDAAAQENLKTTICSKLADADKPPECLTSGDNNEIVLNSILHD